MTISRRIATILLHVEQTIRIYETAKWLGVGEFFTYACELLIFEILESMTQSAEGSLPFSFTLSKPFEFVKWLQLL
jgi:hypothetical protein